MYPITSTEFAAIEELHALACQLLAIVEQAHDGCSNVPGELNCLVGRRLEHEVFLPADKALVGVEQLLENALLGSPDQ